ncbi:TetR/AcrR family transcriptional regulator [Actinocorallia glomerata]|uniref:TetR/AcrR family transcriptional regulator n=3 Tax=Actinomycetota TaxID=201174 RepID=A0ABP6M5G7_9MICC
MHVMVDTTETGLPRAVAVAWGMQETPQRGPSRGLSHERIVAAAVRIADEEGLAAVTMQAVAKSLGFTTMSLYRYVSGKEEMLQLMGDAAARLSEKVTLDPDWRQALRQWAALIREAWRAHPWLREIPRGQVSVLMPNQMRLADLGLQALESLPLTRDDKIGIILVVSQHVASMTELELALAQEGQLTVTEEGAAMLKEVITEERYPHVAPLYQAGDYSPGSTASPPATDEPPVENVEAEYDLGLDLIIAGLESRAGGAAETATRH